MKNVLLLLFMIGLSQGINAQVEFSSHRGSSLHAPENTKASVKLAWEQGADAVEIDVHLSKDNRLMVIHDSNTKRTSGQDYRVEDTLSDTLRMLDVGSFKGEQNNVDPTRKKLFFNKEGKFKIVQFTDVHAIEKKGETDHAYDIMNRILDIEKPDLVMYTGDIVTSDENPKALWEKVTGIASSRDIPFAVTLGNHDAEGRVTRDKIYEIVTGLQGCLNEPKQESVEEVYGYTNQVIPLYKSNNQNEKANILYLFDSNDYHNLPDLPNKDDWIRSNQIAWYVRESTKLTKENNGVPYPAIAFFHIPLHEYRIAATAPNAKILGWRMDSGEGVGAYNSGLFSAFLECGDVKGVFVGHDHDNSYVVLHQGIALAYGHYSGGLNAYHVLCRGARVIELTESEEVFDTWVRLETGRYLYRITIPHSFTSDDPKYRPYP